MTWQVAGLGNALIDALVVLDDDELIAELGLVRGTMHPVDHDRWQQVYERIRHHKVVFESGGSCANTIATCGYLGLAAVYCGQVGNDQMGRMYADRLTEACGKHALHFTNEAHTGKCLSIISGRDAERTMLTNLGAAVTLPELGRFREVLGEARIAHFTGYTLLDGPMRHVVTEAMDIAQTSGALVSLDAADPFVVMEIRDLLWRLLEQYTSIAFLNDEEARGLTGHTGVDAARAIAERAGIDTVVIKMGSRGSMVLRHGEVDTVGVRRVRPVDTTGAGDAFTGVLAAALDLGGDLAAAMHRASVAAGLCCTALGPQTGLPGAAEIEARLAELPPPERAGRG